jgi:hypothetical protein
MCNTDDDHLGLSFPCSFFVKEYSYSRTTTMADEWDFQRIRRFMDEQAAMPASSVLYMNAADLIRQLPAAPPGTWSTIASQVDATNSRLKAPAAAAVELQSVQQSPSKNISFEVPAPDQSKLIFQRTPRAQTFTELVVQASACVEEIRHDLQQDVPIIPAKHAVKRYKMSSSAEKLFNQQTVATALGEADQAHGNPSKRSGKAVYRKQLQQPQTDHEEPNLELRLGNGHLLNVDVQGRTFLYSRAKELQVQRAAGAAAYPISCHIPVEVPRRSPNEFRYRVESRGSVLQQVASSFSRPAAAAPPPIIGSMSTAILPVSSRAAVQEHPLLSEPNHGTGQLEVLKDGARASVLRSYRQQLIMTRSASSSEMSIVLPPVPGPYTNTESYKGPAHHNCSPATTTISNAPIIRHPASVIMGTMGPPPPLMMMSSMGSPPLPEILGPTAARAQSSIISIPFPQGRPLPSSRGRDVSLCKYYVQVLLLELLQLFLSHPIPTAALGLCIPLSFHVVMIQAGMYVVMSFVLVSNM